MSAGGLSYSGLRTSSKVTLPSVEMWGTNMNILKDPSSSIHTRRIDKVGDTQAILDAQDESGDRICEMINVYARGVNPMVSVSYDNFSNNSGRGGSFGNQTQASLPYKVENVRPPVLRQEDLLPLSRLPRNWFYSYTNPSFPDLVQAASCNDQERCVQKEVMHADARTNKSDLMRDDVAVREAPRSAITDLLPILSTTAPRSQPYRTSLREERDTGSEKKSILLEKMEALARTNPGGSHRNEEGGKDFETMDGKRVAENREVISVHTPLSASQRDGNNAEFDALDKGRIQTNKQLYNAFTNKGRETGGTNVDTMDMNKFINKDKYLCIARTNKTVENFQHPLRDADTNKIATKDFLYKKVRTTPTSVFVRDDLDNTVVDPRSLIANPLRASGRSNLVGKERALLEHERMSREYVARQAQPKDVAAGKSASIHVDVLSDSLEGGGKVHEDLLHYSARSAVRMEGGSMPTDSSTTTFALNPRLNVAAETARTNDDGAGQTYLNDAVLHRSLLTKTTGTASTNKTLMGGGDRSDHDIVAHPIREVLVKSTDSRKTYMDAGQNPYHDTVIRSTESQKRTPIHSVITNAQSPFSMTVMPEDLPEQRRRVLHTASTPAAIDLRQVQANADVYSIQSRDSHQARVMLPKGGFDGEGAGTAVPLFDRYGNHEHVFHMTDQRDKLRQLVGNMAQGRYD